MSPFHNGSSEPPDPSRQQPDLIGPYKVLRLLGEGGNGVVYLAEQTQPVKRQIALKVLKPGTDSGQVQIVANSSFEEGDHHAARGTGRH